MNPQISIPPTAVARRRNATKTWHIVRPAAVDAAVRPMACGQKIRKPVNKVAYNAAEITCNDCILAELDRLLARDRQPRTFLDGPREPMYDDEGNLL